MSVFQPRAARHGSWKGLGHGDSSWRWPRLAGHTMGKLPDLPHQSSSFRCSSSVRRVISRQMAAVDAEGIVPPGPDDPRSSRMTQAGAGEDEALHRGGPGGAGQVLRPELIDRLRAAHRDRIAPSASPAFALSAYGRRLPRLVFFGYMARWPRRVPGVAAE